VRIEHLLPYVIVRLVIFALLVATGVALDRLLPVPTWTLVLGFGWLSNRVWERVHEVDGGLIGAWKAAKGVH
jgi:hypothetical protein